MYLVCKYLPPCNCQRSFQETNYPQHSSYHCLLSLIASHTRKPNSTIIRNKNNMRVLCASFNMDNIKNSME